MPRYSPDYFGQTEPSEERMGAIVAIMPESATADSGATIPNPDLYLAFLFWEKND